MELLKAKLVSIDKELKLIKEKEDYISKQLINITNMKTECKLIEHKIETTKNSKFQVDDIIEKYNQNIIVQSEKLAGILDTKKYYEFMLSMFSEDGIKQYLVSNLIAVLNKMIVKYLEDMGCEYTVIIDPNFDFNFLTISGPCEYFNFSEGERRRIDLAVTFSIRNLLKCQGYIQSNILVLDELFAISTSHSLDKPFFFLID
jgi:hypothetical protein